jgi:hypothetical protein
MKATAAVLLLFLFIAPVSAAEDVDPAVVLAKLRSVEPADVAWGAYLSGKHGVKEAVPLLAAHLRPGPLHEGEHGRFVIRAILDALIRLDALVPGDLLVPHLRGRSPRCTFILLAREPGKNRAVLSDYFDRCSKDREYYGIIALAGGNLLCRQKAPGFAARMLGRMKTRLEIRVHDELGENAGVGGGGLRGGCADGRVDMPEGFPPYALYDLVPERGDARRLVADGPRPVFYARKERGGRRIGHGSIVHSFRVPDVTREWLADMAGVKAEALHLPTSTGWDLAWESAEAFTATAVKFRDRYVERYWSLVRRLVARSALTLKEAKAFVPPVTLTVKDKRADQSVPLPAIPESKVDPKLPQQLPTEADTPSRTGRGRPPGSSR